MVPHRSDSHLYATQRGRVDLFRKTHAGSDEKELLLESNVVKRPSSWSPDGRLLAFETGEDIWILPFEGKKESYRFDTTDAREGGVLFSPDGRGMAYESDDSGHEEPARPLTLVVNWTAELGR
ncbi:MAG TPA: hypothetical protein VLK65_02810 [Vicinamibacteria bacterium]|nr:hypothetical protein [Vicinamibacteria bacterium]